MVEIDGTGGRTVDASTAHRSLPLRGLHSHPCVGGLVRSTILIHFHGCSFIHASPGVLPRHSFTLLDHNRFGAVSRLRGALRGSEEVDYMTINHYTTILHSLSLTFFFLCDVYMSHFWSTMFKLVV